MKWEPKGCQIGSTAANQEVCKKHFEFLVKEYGPQTIVNLIDRKG